MKAIIEQSLLKSITYTEYRNRVTTLFAEGKVTGNEQSEALLHYTELNETRMNRLEKTIKISEDIAAKLEYLNRDYIWLLISEGWCGDSAQIVPVIHKMAELSTHIDLRIVFRDENEVLMNLFLTNGTKSVPKLIVLDKNTLEVLGDFGPRPQGAIQLILDYKAQHGVVDEKGKSELHLWYFHDKGLSIQQEIMDLMLSLE
ncbi:thioredoxin family protein [Flavobacterium phycosphaerae]|uniref:thioredoxin family protein n=1 Tax=Flavobacterium phycosphaerae TaxID=2697515 RepID=UPI0013896856|nr:thioredoxin family protein [Flavobacterium phycosphaerae]